jgi:3-hydroxybutyryl-CoA dehydrogenase
LLRLTHVRVEDVAQAVAENVESQDQRLTWGFVGNRINRAVRIEATRIVEEGRATREQVDTIMREGFRWPMGPFELQGGGSLS